MKKIETNKWKNYKLVDLFDIILPSGDIQAQKMDGGSVPLISSGKNNNGVCKYITNTLESNIIHGNSITVDMFGKVFYHDYDYYSVSHGRVNILIPKFELNTYNGLYIANIIEAVTIPKYEFLDMCSQGALMKEIIKRREGLDLGSVRLPLAPLYPEDESVVVEAIELIDNAISKWV